jgi:hypothetical protein
MNVGQKRCGFHLPSSKKLLLSDFWISVTKDAKEYIYIHISGGFSIEEREEDPP